MNLLFAIDRTFIPLLHSCLHSIYLRGGAEYYVAHILHNGLTPEDQHRICAGAAPNISCRFFQVSPALFQGFPTFKRYPSEIYFRLAAAHILPEHLDRILYLDADTIVINALSEFYALDLEGRSFAACTHTGALLSAFNRLRLTAPSGTPYINTGVILMDLQSLRHRVDLQAIRDYANRYKHRLWLPDQDILSALYGLDAKIVDTLRYNLSDRILFLHNTDPTELRIEQDWVEENAVIIHYFGRNKPWKSHYRGSLDVFYHRYGLPLPPQK